MNSKYEILPDLPEWVLFHVPHDSTWIPPSVRSQFLLNDVELQAELLRMTDHWTFDLFAQGIAARRVVRSPVSRLVVDVERFEEDALETMATRGMGAVYERTSDGRRLRHPTVSGQRDELMKVFYHPHHARLAEAAQQAINSYSRVLVIDAHSFPSRPLAHEPDQRSDRPDICIGTDEFHTPLELEQAFLRAFRDTGWTVKLNAPFAGALVPIPLYRKDHRVTAVMVEVNRSLYVDEVSGERRPSFFSVATAVRKCVVSAVTLWKWGKE
jgi:N-formylglutamate amidohydrolase